MDQSTIAALHAAGVASYGIVGIVFVGLLLRYGPRWIEAISKSILEHRRFDTERNATEEAIRIAWANRTEPRLSLQVKTPTVTIGQQNVEGGTPLEQPAQLPNSANPKAQ